jgi:hypothetical protein
MNRDVRSASCEQQVHDDERGRDDAEFRSHRRRTGIASRLRPEASQLSTTTFWRTVGAFATPAI